MAPTRLADVRATTLEDAKAAFATLALAKLRCEKRNASAEVRISKIKEVLALDNGDDAAQIAEAEETLSAFILANRDMFK